MSEHRPHFDLLALPVEATRISLTSSDNCLALKALSDVGGSFLRTALAILWLISWQPLWWPRGSASPAGFNTQQIWQHAYVVDSLLCWSIYNVKLFTNMASKVLHECAELIFALLFPFPSIMFPASCCKISLSQGTRLWLDLFVKDKFQKKWVDPIKRIYTVGVNLLFCLAASGKLMDSTRWNPPSFSLNNIHYHPQPTVNYLSGERG